MKWFRPYLRFDFCLRGVLFIVIRIRLFGELFCLKIRKVVLENLNKEVPKDLLKFQCFVNQKVLRLGLDSY
jgi:predicted thioredoxin/glutaredoxin